MKAKEEILRRVRSANVGAADHPIRREYQHTVELADPLGLFVERVEDYKAKVIRTNAEGIAAAVSESLEGAKSIVVPSGFNKAWVPKGLHVVSDEPPLSSAELDKVEAVVTTAVVGIAVTGTLVLDHTEGQGRRVLSLIPDRHVCVIRADQIVGDVPEAVGRLSDSVHAGRALTWISGPSATVDIELIRVFGVHGPRTLRIVLVE